MIESRCGIVCSECEFKETMHCLGCINITKPFWGEICPIKHCVEEQGYQHCGECAKFPCEMAKQFAYDEKQGDNGKRLCQCAAWKENIPG